MIPKIIHFIWVGDNPKSELAKKCIASWKKFCPDYQIMEWGNDALKEIDNIYLKEAFECKKWAFVSDYLRLYALSKFGGIYCDTDLELTQHIDKFLDNSFFTGYESWEGKISPITALMGAEKNNPIIADLLKDYDSIHFITNGKMDLTTNVLRISKYFEKKFNLNSPYNGNNTTKLDNNVIIYPSYFFCTPENWKENYSIHHFNGSWVDGYNRKNFFKFFKFRIVKYKKRLDTSNNRYPLLPLEKIIFLISISNRKKIALVKEK